MLTFLTIVIIIAVLLMVRLVWKLLRWMAKSSSNRDGSNSRPCDGGGFFDDFGGDD